MLQDIPAQVITVHVSDPLYRRLSRRAEQRRRAVEDELLEAVVSGLLLDEELPPGLEDDLQQLTVLSNETLLQVACSRLTPAQSRALEQLHRHAQVRALSAEEDQHEQELTHLYERTMLLRARAVRLLAERGVDVSPLLLQP